ncbi:MAG TPA: phage tail sheath subtilisin-like domain-containing protein [Longimicrobium sp.]|jgi:hypothetical protein
MPTFLHGVETVESAVGPRPVRSVRTAVVGLVGTAPIWQADAADRRVNEPVLITGDVDAEKYFGSADVAGYTIPAALKAIFDQGAGAVIVVNVFDPAVHHVAVPLNEHASSDDVYRLVHRGVSNVVVTDDGGANYVGGGVDYTVDAAAGTVTRAPGGAIPAGTALLISYSRPHPAGVTPVQVIGGVNGAGKRTGMQALRDAAAVIGFGPKLLLAPAFDSQATVVAELLTIAEQLRAIALWDAPVGTTVANAIAGRGPSGAINFASSSGRGVACYPHVRVLDAASGDVVLAPYAPRVAGAIAARDERDGYQVSPSNMEIRGIVGMERPLTADFRDASSDVNRLNEVGIVTIYHGFGSGLRVWGNRTTAWPADTHPLNFIPVRRTADMLYDAVELIAMQYLGQPYTAATVDVVRESVNAFLRSLMAEGRLIAGECTFDPARNTADKIAAGHLTFDISFMPPTVAERFTLSAFVDTSLLSALAPAA